MRRAATGPTTPQHVGHTPQHDIQRRDVPVQGNVCREAQGDVCREACSGASGMCILCFRAAPAASQHRGTLRGFHCRQGMHTALHCFHAFGSEAVIVRMLCLDCSLTLSLCAGDWQAAALALSRIHTDVQQQWELLAVRAELRATNSAAGSGSQGIGAALEASTETLAGSEAGVGAGGAGTADNVDPTGLRQLLKLLDARHCAAMASMAADSMDSVRWALEVPFWAWLALVHHQAAMPVP